MSMTAPRIVVHPTTDPACPHRFVAVDDAHYGGEETDPIGYGETEAEAIDDLLEQMEAGNDD